MEQLKGLGGLPWWRLGRPTEEERLRRSKGAHIDELADHGDVAAEVRSRKTGCAWRAPTWGSTLKI